MLQILDDYRYFNCENSEIFAQYNFSHADPQPNYTVASYIIILHNAAEHCGFMDKEDRIAESFLSQYPNR